MIARAPGGTAFGPGAARAADKWDTDVARRAALYLVSGAPPHLGRIAADAMALTAWCFGPAKCEAVVHAVQGEIFSGVEMTETRLAAIAAGFGPTKEDLAEEDLAGARKRVTDSHAVALQAALGAGAFGGPTVLTEGGAVFFGQ